MTIAPIEVLEANAACETLDTDGNPVSLRAALCDHTVTAGVASRTADASARRALANARKTLEYYQSVHSRDSFDNEGAALVNLVHIGEKFDNAFWNSELKVMAYGDGDGVETSDFTLGVDVAGHEMTHAVTSSTADLIYMGQSGALNEAYSDIFGKMIADDGDWAVRQRSPSMSGVRGWTWFSEADGFGKSLELVQPGLDNSFGQNWGASTVLNGTPGTVNSIRVANTAPLIVNGTHLPIIPKSNEPVGVTARLLDESTAGVSAVLFFRTNTAGPTAFVSTPMLDDGAHGDGAPGDGIYGALLAAMPNNTLIEFYIQATDSLSLIHI